MTTENKLVARLNLLGINPAGWFTWNENHGYYQQVAEDFEAEPGMVPLYDAAAVTAAIAAIASRGGEGWQSIETAPKNRKVLVAYRNPLGNWRVVTACFHTELPWSDDAGWDSESEFAPEAWYEESDSQDSILPTASLPTHWHALPPYPGERRWPVM